MAACQASKALEQVRVGQANLGVGKIGFFSLAAAG